MLCTRTNHSVCLRNAYAFSLGWLSRPKGDSELPHHVRFTLPFLATTLPPIWHVVVHICLAKSPHQLAGCAWCTKLVAGFHAVDAWCSIPGVCTLEYRFAPSGSHAAPVKSVGFTVSAPILPNLPPARPRLSRPIASGLRWCEVRVNL